MKKIQSIPYPTYTTAERDALVGVLLNTKINNSDTGKVEEYDGVNWISQSSGGGGSSAITSKTYAELQDLVSNNLLVPESTYIITDYQTKHLISNSNPKEINIGNIEPLTLIAATTNSFYVEAKSSLFPSDIIHYRFDDGSCENGTRDVVNKKWVGGTPRPGYISYRKSTTNLLSTHYDWRNYKVRRWKLDCVEWVGGTAYKSKDVVKSPINGNIYVCKKVVTKLNTTDPSQDTENYQLYLDLSIQNNGGYLSYTPVSANFNVGNITKTNLIIKNTTPNVDYKDYYTFCILTEPTNSSGVVLTNINGGKIGEGFKDFEIGKFDFEFSNATNLMGDNVFYLLPNRSSESNMYSVKIGGSASSNTFCSTNNYSNVIGDLFRFNVLQKGKFSSNTIGNNFYSNTMEDNFYSNTIGNGFNSNTIRSGLYFNTIGDDFRFNIIGNNFKSNTIRDSFQSNTIDTNFISNTIRDSFQSNTIGYNFKSNTIGSYLKSNTIGNSFDSNTIGDYFYYNTIGNTFSYNTIGVYFNSSTIGNDFYYNTIGFSFYSNTIGYNFKSNTIGNNFQSNKIGNSFQNNEVTNNISSTDWLNTVPTPIHVYQTYNCKIFKNSSGILRLSYYNENDQLVITDITA